MNASFLSLGLRCGWLCVRVVVLVCVFFFSGLGDHRVLHVLTHSFPTRRSSDLFALVVANFPSDGFLGACTRMGKLRNSGDSGGGYFSSNVWRSEEHTSDLQSLMRIPYAAFCLTKKNTARGHTGCTSPDKTTNATRLAHTMSAHTTPHHNQ